MLPFLLTGSITNLQQLQRTSGSAQEWFPFPRNAYRNPYTRVKSDWRRSKVAFLKYLAPGGAKYCKKELAVIGKTLFGAFNFWVKL